MSFELSDDELKAAAQRLLAHAPQPGSCWQHFKGGLYEVVACSIREDDLEPLVTYRSLKCGTTWTRTLANWRELVPVPHGPDVQRFRQQGAR